MKIEKHYRLKGKISNVKKILTNLEFYGKLHPLIKSVEIINNKTTECDEYIISEKPYSWIPIQIKYSAKVKSFENKIEYKIEGLPFSTSKITYKLNQLPEEIQLKFQLVIEGKLIGKSILLKKMIKAQNELINAINKELANPILLK